MYVYIAIYEQTMYVCMYDIATAPLGLVLYIYIKLKQTRFKKVLKGCYLIGQDNAIYNFLIEISLSSKGQNKSKLHFYQKFVFCIVLSY